MIFAPHSHVNDMCSEVQGVDKVPNTSTCDDNRIKQLKEHITENQLLIPYRHIV
jgi:hypothetical protein